MTRTPTWGVVAELAASQHGAFHRSQAASISTYRLRAAVDRGELRRPLSDVFVIAAVANTWKQRLMVLALAGGTISHRAAAGLHQLDGVAPGKLEFTVSRGSRRRLPPRVAVHQSRIDPVDVAVVDGIAVTSIPRTLIDLAQVVPQATVESALDAALRSGVTVDEIRAVMHRLHRPGRTGLGPLRDLLDDPRRAGPAPDSLFERRVERLILDAGFPPPVRQHEVRLPGQGVRRLDLAWPWASVGVECHSKRWHFGRRAEHDDNRRDLELAAAGWEVIYVTWQLAQTPHAFLKPLQALLDRRHPARGSGV